MRGLLPESVRTACLSGDAGADELFPEEAAAVARAVPARRAEFATVRYLARRALVQLGEPPVPLPPGPDRAPIWPAGVVGSLSHCPGFRAAAVARSDRIASIGIDAEPDAPLPAGVAELVCLPEERVALAGLSRRLPGLSWDRLLFSAKESVFKCWHPLMRCWLDFLECELRILPEPPGDRGLFEGRLLVPGPPGPDGGRIRILSGRWRRRDGVLLTAVHLPRSAVGRTVGPTAG